MTWQPEPRPDWLASVNAGEVLALRLEADLTLDRESLLGEAAAQLGLDPGDAPWGEDDFLEPLDLWLTELEGPARLSVFGRWFTRRFVRRLLAGRRDRLLERG